METLIVIPTSAYCSFDSSMISTCSSVATALVVIVVKGDDLSSGWCRPEGWRWRKGG